MNKIVTQTGPKLDTPTRMKVLAMMARGEKYATIKRILLEDHNIKYSVDGLTKLKTRHSDTLKEMEYMILEKETSDAEAVRAKSLRQLSRKLDKAATDETEIEELDRQWREGEIEDMSEYRRRKAGLLKLNVKDLAEISKNMHSQTAGRKGANALPVDPNATPATDPKWVEALMLAVQNGDTIAMQQLIITPNA